MYVYLSDNPFTYDEIYSPGLAVKKKRIFVQIHPKNLPLDGWNKFIMEYIN